jgi:hypothetical protein
MSKTKDANIEKQPTLLEELLKNGKTTITATSRDELFEKFNEIKASAKDVTLSTGAVGRSSDTGTFMLQIDIVKL